MVGTEMRRTNEMPRETFLQSFPKSQLVKDKEAAEWMTQYEHPICISNSRYAANQLASDYMKLKLKRAGETRQSIVIRGKGTTAFNRSDITVYFKEMYEAAGSFTGERVNDPPSDENNRSKRQRGRGGNVIFRGRPSLARRPNPPAPPPDAAKPPEEPAKPIDKRVRVSASMPCMVIRHDHKHRRYLVKVELPLEDGLQEIWVKEDDLKLRLPSCATVNICQGFTFPPETQCLIHIDTSKPCMPGSFLTSFSRCRSIQNVHLTYSCYGKVVNSEWKCKPLLPSHIIDKLL